MDSTIFDIQLKGSADQLYEIIPIGDLHIGAAGCQKNKIYELVDYIKDSKNVLWMGMGDYCECINIMDPRFDPYSVADDYDIKDTSRLVQKQIDEVTEIFSPIRDKCMGILVGNHEETIRLHYCFSVGYELAKNLQVKSLGYSGYVRLKFHAGDKDGKVPLHTTTYDFYLMHGWGGARKTGGKANRIEDCIADNDVDVVVLAHEHQRMLIPPVMRRKMDAHGNIITTPHWGFMSGCYKKGHVKHATTYEERKGYRETSIGTVKVIVHSRYKEITGAMI